MRIHGGDPGEGMARHGGTPEDWLDLSTGINPVPYPLPDIPARAWAALPAEREIAAVEDAARAAYATPAQAVALAGAQAAIQLVPHLGRGGAARVLGPTYEEHEGALVEGGWQVTQVREMAALAGADLAVVVNPNNPDGRRHAPGELRALAGRVGLLVVDESFADAEPALSLAARLGPETDRLVVLRSFGKFYGLAGLRLGFALAGDALAERLRMLAGPWRINGPAVAVGRAALADTGWQDATRARLAQDAARLDRLAAGAGWRLVGGTPLFRTYDVGDGTGAQDRLARARIWTRAFPYAPSWLRLGLPGTEDGWVRLARALRA
ncbi:threonine-phosphate decarboxylase [Rhodovulum sp. 12E13]|uniref:threonine-phosphate decarboxylase CobD n=1 Tax=Rhodovulum sp. 12E13 TaxID=2203891 RepID=UPI000E176E9F|nr:threonine-phosphate decarboxylase CobD [Rhodovulum sp. 12E13]RDC72625.1 threonine-phosphate decarboxylase [Rhodovulum sp. 12E13]